MVADLSQRSGWLQAADVERIETLLKRAQLSVRAPAANDPSRFLELMAVDKKVQGGRLRLVLLKAIGER